jgi:soluble lytic murein transglycosylase-like protein
MRGSDLFKMIEVAALRHDLDPSLIMAIIHAESGYNRAHEEYILDLMDLVDVDGFAQKLNIPSRSERYAQRSRLGLMGILGATARAYGFEKDLDALLDEKENIYLGCKILQTLFDKYENENAIILAWRGYSTVLPPKAQPEKEKEYLRKVKSKLVVLRAIEG